MASVGDVAAGLASQLSIVTGIRATDYVPDSINPPAAFVNLTGRAVDDFDGSLILTFDLIVLVSRASARVGTGTLYEFVSGRGDQSVDQAINDNQDLNLTDGTRAVPGEYRSLGIEEIAAYGYMGGAFAVVVTTPG